MSPELIAAVKERLELGHSLGSIRKELIIAGHSKTVINEVLKTVQTVDLVSAKHSVVAMPVNLPRASSLFNNSFNFVKSRPDLFFALAAPFTVLVLLSHFLSDSPLSKSIGLFGITALIFYVLVLGSVLYIVSQSREESMPLKEAFNWSRKNIWGLVWVYILAALVTYGGFLLFIIPGIIVSFLVYFSQYVYVKEGVRGLDALLRSRDLVLGNWWSVAGRLVTVGFMFLGVFLVLGLIAGLFISAVGENSTSEFVLAVAMQLISAGASLMGLHVGMELYQSLATVRPVVLNTHTSKDKWKYRLLAIFGIILGAIILPLLVTYVVLNAPQDQNKNNLMQQNLFDSNTEMNESTTSVGTSAKERAAELREAVLQDGKVNTGVPAPQ